MSGRKSAEATALEDMFNRPTRRKRRREPVVYEEESDSDLEEVEEPRPKRKKKPSLAQLSKKAREFAQNALERNTVTWHYTCGKVS